MFTLFVALFLGIYQIIFGSYQADSIDQFLREQQFLGTVLIAKEGQILFCKGYGYANSEHQILNSADTVFRLASITKQFTAVAILQLQEQGLLSINDPIEKYLPGYPHGDKITIHHLLTHTSGIAEITDFPNLSELQRLPSTPRKVISYFKDLPLQFPPGSQCVYCNSGYIVLGAIIEVVVGCSYEEYLKEKIFSPLGLQATYYDSPQAIIPNRASGYKLDDNGDLKHAEFIEMSFPHAAGGLASTVKDLYTWNKALREHKILSEESLSALLRVQASDDSGKLTYGYGLCIGPRNEHLSNLDDAVLGHIGTIEGFRAALIYYPRVDLTVIVLSNLEDTDIIKTHQSIASIIFTSFWR